MRQLWQALLSELCYSALYFQCISQEKQPAHLHGNTVLSVKYVHSWFYLFLFHKAVILTSFYPVDLDLVLLTRFLLLMYDAACHTWVFNLLIRHFWLIFVDDFVFDRCSILVLWSQTASATRYKRYDFVIIKFFFKFYFQVIINDLCFETCKNNSWKKKKTSIRLDRLIHLFLAVGAWHWGEERFGSMMDWLIYLQIMSPYGQINVRDVCYLWVKSLRMALANLIPSAESTGNDTTLWSEIEVILYVYYFPCCKKIRYDSISFFVMWGKWSWPTDPAALTEVVYMVQQCCVCKARMPE